MNKFIIKLAYSTVKKPKVNLMHLILHPPSLPLLYIKEITNNNYSDHD